MKFYIKKNHQKQSENRKNSIEEKNFDLPHPAFGRSRSKGE